MWKIVNIPFPTIITQKYPILRVGRAFCDLGKNGLKTQKLSFCQFNSVQMKHNFKKLKEAFVKNISIFSPMVLVSTDDNCTDFGVHFPKPIFEYLHTIFYVTT